MQIKNLKLTNFRNFTNLDLDLVKGLNVIIGQNGVGKTNIVEAIHYLSLARSFRTNDDQTLINLNASEAKIIASLHDSKRDYLLEITINQTSKRVKVNDVPINRLSRLAELVNVIVFEPQDVNFFNVSPGTRRKFLDVGLTKTKNQYLPALTKYEKLLKERNLTLKADKIDDLQIDVLTNQMVEVAEVIVRNRQEFIERLNEIVPTIVSELDEKLGEVKLVYHPFVEVSDNFNSDALKAFKKNKHNDYKYRSTSTGIQREDFDTLLNGQDVALFASQGQKRIIALAIMLAPYFLAKNEKERPIVVLDDALSELDVRHQQKLIAFLKKIDQTFITTTTFPFNGDELYEVKDDQKIITRRFV